MSSINITVEEQLQYPTNAEIEGWIWQLGIFQSNTLIVCFGIPFLLMTLSALFYTYNVWNAKQNGSSGGINETEGEENFARLSTGMYDKALSRRNIKAADNDKSLLCRLLQEGFRIDTSPLRVKELLEEEYEACCSDEFLRAGKLYKLHPQSNITEDDIRKAYPDLVFRHDEDHNVPGKHLHGDHVVLFFRFASIFVASGMSTIENQEILRDVGKALKLPPLSLLNLGLSEITVQFQLGPVVNVSCHTEAFYQLSLLSRTQQLARCVVENANKEKEGSSKMIPAGLYLRVLDRMEQDHAADPYGWLLRLLAVYLVSVFAPMAVYSGGYVNLFWASIISVAIVLELSVLQYLPPSVGDRWETPIVSFTTGLMSSVLWQATASWFDVDQCAANYTIGVLLIWFPGSSLVYGAHEVCLGSYTNGGIRLIKGIVSAMVIALFYLVGWQFWGRNWASDELMNGVPTNLYNTTGPIASLPPSIGCESPNNVEIPWYITQVGFSIPLNAATMVIFNIRLRDCPGVFLVAQLTYCVQGFLSAQDKDITFEQLPTYVNILLVAFSGGCFAEINQLITGFSKYGSMLAIIFVLAPGAGCVRAILGAFHRYEGDYDSNWSSVWESVIMEGVTYAVGFYLAFDVLAPIIAFFHQRKSQERERGVRAEKDERESDFDQTNATTNKTAPVVTFEQDSG